MRNRFWKGTKVKKAIVIGATSGIGRELALMLSQNGYTVCITGRRSNLLEQAQAGMNNGSFFRQMDVTDAEAAINTFNSIAEEMGGVDLVVISAGKVFVEPELSWQNDKITIDTNASGFAAMASTAYRHFEAQGAGHLVGITSVAAVRGGGTVAYNESKAFASSFLAGLRFRTAKLGLPIQITDVRPGFVDTALAKGEDLFWVQPLDKAAGQIYRAIRREKMSSM